MGYMTEVGILNDHWDEIRKNPAEFVEQIYQSSTSYGHSPRWIIGHTTVARTHHADTLHVYFAARNSFFEAYPDKCFDKRRLGYHLESLKEMKRYLKVCEDETKRRIADELGDIDGN